MTPKSLRRKIRASLPCLAACLLAMLPAACKTAGTLAPGGMKSGQEKREFSSLSRERTVFLYPDAPNSSPALKIALSLLDVSRPENRFILAALYDGQGPEEYAEKRLHGYDDMYGEMRGTAEQFPDMPRESLNWFYSETIACDAVTSKAAVISREWEYYTGGAHGLRNKSYYVFGLEEARRLGVWDVVREEARPALEDLVEAALRKRMEIPDWIPLSEKGFFEDSVDKLVDFFLGSVGLGFQWDPYEIAPYSIGLMEIVIPYGELEGMLTGLGASLAKDLR